MSHRLGFGRPLGIALTVGAFAAALPLSLTPGAASGAPFGGSVIGGSGEDETTISVQAQGDSQATVVHVPDLKVGESRTINAESGKPVVITRTEGGYTLRVGEKDIQVKMLDGDGVFVMKHGEGGTGTFIGGDGSKKVVVMKHGFGWESGDAARPSMAELLDKHELKALKGADRRTRDTVLEALKELSESGAIILPGAHHPRIIVDADSTSEGGDGDKVTIKVIRRKAEPGDQN